MSFDDLGKQGGPPSPAEAADRDRQLAADTGVAAAAFRAMDDLYRYMARVPFARFTMFFTAERRASSCCARRRDNSFAHSKVGG